MQLIEFTNQDNIPLRGLLSSADSPEVVVCLHGFERTAIEHKFKDIEERLRGVVNVFRFDFTGLGLSDGDFSTTTVARLVEDVAAALQAITDQISVSTIRFVTHSLGGVVLAQYLLENTLPQLGKSVMLAPAFNQRAIFRLWYVMREVNKPINWNNYQQYLDEEAFQKSLQNPAPLKSHEIDTEYFIENSERNLNEIITDQDWLKKIMIVHGDADTKVPIESNSVPASLVVRRGDHDLEKPAMRKQWLDPVITWLTS